MTASERKKAMLAALRALAAEIKLAREDLRHVSTMPAELDRIAGIVGTGATAARRILALGSSYREASRGRKPIWPRRDAK